MTSCSSLASLVPRRSRPSTPECGLRENFYHGSLGREEAEQVLRVAGFSEGLFLIRQSQSAKGDFVLSVVVQVNLPNVFIIIINDVQGSFIHYQIRRNGEDALFSLSAEKKVGA